MPTKEKPSQREMIGALSATSTQENRQTVVILYWIPVKDAVGYNLYRQEIGSGRGSITLVNTDGLIRPVQSCDELKAIITPDSPEWRMIRSAIGTVIQTRESQESKQDNRDKNVVGFPRVSQINQIRSGSFTGEQQLKGILERQRTDPCNAFERGLIPEEVALLHLVAKNNLKIAQAMGLSYFDKTVTKGSRYMYTVKAVFEDNKESTTGSSTIIVAGVVPLPDPPAGITATAGDSRVLLTWERNYDAYGYIVERSSSPALSFERIHEGVVTFDVESVLDDPDSPKKPGFLDYQRWDKAGLPSNHAVYENAVEGPKNNTLYYYRVASCDIFGRTGDWSPVFVSAKPRDLTSPMAPTELGVDYSKDYGGLTLTWRKVTEDVLGHQEFDQLHTYEIYRADASDLLTNPENLSLYMVYSFTVNPQDKENMTLSWTDTNPAIIPIEGEKEFFYRICCIDSANNKSAPSAIVSGRIPDTFPPGPTYVIRTKGYPDKISVFWKPNTEKDLAGYQIYRSVCDHGEVKRDEIRQCGFVLIGQVLVDEAEVLLETYNEIFFEDTLVPKDSPVCWAYWVRAFDQSSNLYNGHNFCPASHNEYKCGRLTERSPPPTPIITGLKAGHRSIMISWSASPIQDQKAFHIYRSDEEDGDIEFIGCVLRDGTVYVDINGNPRRWEGINPVCDDIPAKPEVIMESFLDRNLEPNHIYWYRVSALDWLGNESEGENISTIPAVSTFTYTRDLPPIPVIRTELHSLEGCGITIQWNPQRDGKNIEGFIVYRSSEKSGPFRQVSPIIRKNEFVDFSAPRKGENWYQVQSIDPDGRLSEPSTPVLFDYKKKTSRGV